MQLRHREAKVHYEHASLEEIQEIGGQGVPRTTLVTLLSRTLQPEGAEGARNRGTPRGEKRVEEKPCGLEPRGRELTPEAG